MNIRGRTPLQLTCLFVLFITLFCKTMCIATNLHTQETTYTSTILETNQEADTGLPMSYFSRLFDNFHCVQRDVLYRSKQLPAKKLKRYIKKYHIKSVINLRGENKHMRWWQKEDKATKECGIKFYNIPMRAQTLSEKENLHELLRIYKQAPRPILIHCKSGSDRTGEAAALWKLEEQKASKKKAFKQLSMRYGYFRHRRPAKYFLIQIWQDCNWFACQYDHKNYPIIT